MGGFKKITHQTRANAYSKVLEMPVSIILEQMKLSPTSIERMIAETMLTQNKVKQTIEEQIYSAWCAGNTYTELCDEFKTNRYKVNNAISKVRQQIIDAIDAQFKTDPILSDPTWEFAPGLKLIKRQTRKMKVKDLKELSGQIERIRAKAAEQKKNK